MKREIEVTATPSEVAEMLFNLDNHQVAEVFSQWHRLFEECYEERKRTGQTIWIYDLTHFMMHVIPEMDDDALNVVRCMYSSLVTNMIDDVEKKHFTETFIK